MRRTRNYRARSCPGCGRRAGRYALDTRRRHDLAGAGSERPRDLLVTFSRQRCRRCGCCFATDLADLAAPTCLDTRRAGRLAVRLVALDALPYRAASWHLWRDHRARVPFATVQNWVEDAGEKMPGGEGRSLPR